MSTRLQVILDDEEIAEIRAFAKRQRLTVAEWVRQVLRVARQDDAAARAARKLAALEKALSYDFGLPAETIEAINADLEESRLSDPSMTGWKP